MIVIAVFILGFMAYFVSHFDHENKIWYDGLGRQFVPSPWFMRLIFGQERAWAGGLWWAVDMVAFWSGLIAGGALATWGFTAKNSNLT
jgi:hypothetical protein